MRTRRRTAADVEQRLGELLDLALEMATERAADEEAFREHAAAGVGV